MNISPKILPSEFRERIARIQNAMDAKGMDALLVYGDEYRKENLRYVSNFWPIFERAACIIGKSGEPIMAGAPEGEQYMREMNVWADQRNVKDFACVSVPDEIDYPLARFSSFSEILSETLKGGKRLGIAGWYDIPFPIFQRIREAIPGLELVDAGPLLADLRLIKTEAEIACLKEAGKLACVGYEALMKHAIPGNTELEASGAAEGAARRAGAEGVTFMVFGSGARAGTIIGRPTRKIIEEGDMIMAAFAVQYEGYVATVEYPFVAGKASDQQKRFLAVLMEAANEQLKYLKEGVIAGEMVRAVKRVFCKHRLSEYDVYPPLHGAGLAEAESPYPDENATYPFKAGMCVNSDISLFGAPGGSNRLEEGFVIRKDGPESTTPLIRKLCEQGGLV
jgi:Xaa-Pro aminopeptidase